jgi:lipid-binding SYLF domain-containing protein
MQGGMNACLRVFALATFSAAAAGGCHSTGSKEPRSAADVEEERTKAEDRVSDAASIVGEIAGGDATRKIPEAITRKAECVAVVPALLEGAFIIGAKRGRGVATCRIAGGWSAPGFFTVGGGTAGAQIGARSADILMLINSERAKRSFLAGDLRVGTEVSATAGTVGSGRGVDTTETSLRSEVVSYSRGRGLFAGVDLTGVVVHGDPEATHAVYGPNEDFSKVLTRTEPASPQANQFLGKVSQLFVRP